MGLSRFLDLTQPPPQFRDLADQIQRFYKINLASQSLVCQEFCLIFSIQLGWFDLYRETFYDMSDPPSLTNEAIILDPTASLSHSISRWSDKGIREQPAVVIVPETEQDILAAIDYARENALQVLLAGGGHGSFVDIGSETLYLDLKRFKQIEVNKATQTAKVGGGVVTGELIKALTDKGFYTTWTNSNGVGVVGSILGGGNVS